MFLFAHPSGPPSSRGERFKQLIAALGLDEKTLTEVNTVLDASHAEHQELRRKLYEAREHMRSLLEQERPDEAAVMSQADTIGALETQAQKLRLQTILHVRALLTPEQRAKLLDMLRARGFHQHRGARRFFEDQPPQDPEASPSPGRP
jgi:Spy/CpxP family protein refolding chaperone